LLFYISPLIISAVLGLFLALFILRNRPAPGSRALVAMILGASLWSTGYALEFLSPGLESKLLWAKFQYLGITTIPLAWFIFAARNQGSPGWSRRSFRIWALLAIIPLVTLCLVWSNQFHGLIWRQVQLLSIGPVQMLEIHHGPWFWVYWIYSYGLLFLGSFRLVRALFGTVHLHRWQTRLALLAVLIPWFGNLIYVAGLSPLPGLDWTPFGFTFAGLLFVISLFRFQLVKIMPIAEKTVFIGLPDCLLVLDAQDCLVDLNQAARTMIGNPGNVPFGKPLSESMSELASWVSQADFNKEFRVEISQGEKPDQRFYELRVTPLYGPYSFPIGRLVVCHEITQHKQQQAFLEQTVAERTGELRQAVEQLQNELAQRTLAEKRFEEVIESAPDAMLLVDQAGSIKLVNAQAERLFGYSREELLGKNIIESLVPIPHRNRQRNYLMQFIDNPEGRRTSFGLDLSARRKDGSQFPVEISLGKLNTREGVWVACNVRDISESKKAEEEQNRLVEEIRQSREQLRALAFHLQEVQEFERRQISRELHDRVGQNLTGLNLNLQIVQNQLLPECSAQVQSRLADSLKLVEETTRQVRDVLADLHPPMLDEFGLFSALQMYGNIFSQRSGVDTRVTGSEIVPRLPPKDEMVLFRLVQEALHNVAKHARATRVEIRVESADEGVFLTVQDDGLGFDPRTLVTPADQSHWGIISMRQRAESIGAQLSIDSAPGRGTMISVNYRR
jgi:PAS domain S-box-containing protein